MALRDRTAITLALVWSGKYNIPGQFDTVRGFDAFGEPMEEKIPALDHERLNAEVERILMEVKQKKDQNHAV